MNILLFAPGLLLIFLERKSVAQTTCYLTLCAATQVRRPHTLSALGSRFSCCAIVIGSACTALLVAQSSRLRHARIQPGPRVHVQVDCELALSARTCVLEPTFSFDVVAVSRRRTGRILLA